MEQRECSETSAHNIRTPGNHPKERIQHSEHGGSLKSETKVYCSEECYALLPLDSRRLSTVGNLHYRAVCRRVHSVLPISCTSELPLHVTHRTVCCLLSLLQHIVQHIKLQLLWLILHSVLYILVCCVYCLMMGAWGSVVVKALRY